MPGSRIIISPSAMRFLNRLALLAAILVTLAIPSIYSAISIHATRSALDLETTQVARNLEQVVINRPDLWNYEVQRLQEFIDKASLQGTPEDRSVHTLAGQRLVETTFHAPRPVLQSTRVIYDSGRPVGFVEARRSIREIAIQTLIITLLSALFGWGLFIIFRLLPVRALTWALAELSGERQNIAATLRAIPDGVIAADGAGTVLFLNPAAEAFLGCMSAAAVGKPLAEIYPIQRKEEPAPGTRVGRGEIRLSGGPVHIIEERFSSLPTEGGGRTGQVTVFRDITSQVKVEAELLRVRQIESLGVLAGGIAHDFNNYLSAILGNISLAKQDVPPGGRASERLLEAMKATDRARSLSLKLLTFAKGGDPARRVVDLAALVREATDFVTHGTGVQVTCTFPPGLWNAEVDDGLMSQVIHNLIINAVQAMQGHGHIHISLENVRVDEGEILYLQPGRYLRTSLRDSGPGIPESILPRIFEPYFTTKSAGHGLGLASCFNILKAHGGSILAESTEGAGATFLLYVPATDKTMEPKAITESAPPPQGRGHVLVMDDDLILREIAAEMLERTGFTAQTCPDGKSAIKTYAQALKAGSPFRAVIMDLTIPGGMGGREAAAQILAIHPEARLIVSSGYSVDPVLARPKDFGFLGVLPKPYGLPDLARVLDEVVHLGS